MRAHAVIAPSPRLCQWVVRHAASRACVDAPGDAGLVRRVFLDRVQGREGVVVLLLHGRAVDVVARRLLVAGRPDEVRGALVCRLRCLGKRTVVGGLRTPTRTRMHTARSSTCWRRLLRASGHAHAQERDATHCNTTKDERPRIPGGALQLHLALVAVGIGKERGSGQRENKEVGHGARSRHRGRSRLLLPSRKSKCFKRAWPGLPR